MKEVLIVLHLHLLLWILAFAQILAMMSSVFGILFILTSCQNDVGRRFAIYQTTRLSAGAAVATTTASINLLLI
jgi:hypothetical protein